MKNVLRYKKTELSDLSGAFKGAPKYQKIKDPKQDFEKAINCFLRGESGKYGKYVSVPNALVYRSMITNDTGGVMEVRQNIIAARINGIVLGNSSILPLIGRTVAFGNSSNNRSITPVQETLGSMVPMLPFSVFIEASLDLNAIEILERGSDETINRKYENTDFSSYDKKQALKKGKKYETPEFLFEDVHFTGAFLFKIESKFFLFDIDREEIAHSIFNPFLVEIPKPVATIEEAYHALIPNEVHEAKAKGLKVIRQGEFFFIPMDSKVKADIHPDEDSRWGRSSRFIEGKLQAGRNRPNFSGFVNKETGYIKGKVRHSGREHRTILLRTWHKAVTNTSEQSFTITGDID